MTKVMTGGSTMGKTLKITAIAAIMYATTAAVAAAAGGILSPGRPQAPPGSGKAQTIMNWVEWVGFGCRVAGIIMVASTLALEHRHGGGGMGGGAGGGVIRVLIAVILIGGAGGIVGALAS